MNSNTELVERAFNETREIGDKFWTELGTADQAHLLRLAERLSTPKPEVSAECRDCAGKGRADGYDRSGNMTGRKVTCPTCHGGGAIEATTSPEQTEWDHRYRLLEEGEIILATDELQHDDGSWIAPLAVGTGAPSSSYISHRTYRRLKEQTNTPSEVVERECPSCLGRGEFYNQAPGLPRASEPTQCADCYGTGFKPLSSISSVSSEVVERVRDAAHAVGFREGVRHALSSSDAVGELVEALPKIRLFLNEVGFGAGFSEKGRAEAIELRDICDRVLAKHTALKRDGSDEGEAGR